MRHEATGNSKKVKVIGVALCAMLFALCLSAQAQQSKKVARIGYLSVLSPVSDSARIEAFAKVCARRATLTDRTSPLSLDMRRGSWIGSPTWRGS